MSAWLTKINGLIQSTEAHLSQVDGRKPSYSPTPYAHQQAPTPDLLSGAHFNTTTLLSSPDRTIPSYGVSAYRTSHLLDEDGLIGVGMGALEGLRSETPSSRMLDSAKGDSGMLMELNLLKKQFLLFKENSDRSSQSQKAVISSQNTQIEDLKHELLIKSQLEDDLIMRVKKAVREEVLEEVMQLKFRMQTVEVGLGNAGELATTHTTPIHARMEQLSHTVHTTVGQLRNEMARVKSTMDSFLGNATQAQSLGPYIQQEVGGLRSMVSEWNAMFGTLKNEVELLKSAVDRATGISTAVSVIRNDMYSLRDTVERTVGLHSAVSSLRSEVEVLRSAVERNSGWHSTAGNLRSELSLLQAKLDHNQTYSGDFSPQQRQRAQPPDNISDIAKTKRSYTKHRESKSKRDRRTDASEFTREIPVIDKRVAKPIESSDSEFTETSGRDQHESGLESPIIGAAESKAMLRANDIPAQHMDHVTQQDKLNNRYHSQKVFQDKPVARPTTEAHEKAHQSELQTQEPQRNFVEESEVSPRNSRQLGSEDAGKSNKVDVTNETYHDGHDTEVYKTDTDNTEVVYDRTDTDLQMASELHVDGTDTEALETDISFRNEPSLDKKDTTKTTHSRQHSDPPYQPHNNDANQSVKQLSSLKPGIAGYETDAKTEDDFSFTSFEAKSELSRHSASGLEKATNKPSSVGYGHEHEHEREHESDGMGKTEDDFSDASFDSDGEGLKDDNPDPSNAYLSDGAHSSSSSYITAEPTEDQSLEELVPRNRFNGRDDDANSDSSVRRSNKLFSRFISKKSKRLSANLDASDRDDLSSSDTDSSLMDSWNRVMGPSSIALPPSLLKSSSRNSPISARKMYSEDEDERDTGSAAMAKTSSFLTYEQFSKQFDDTNKTAGSAGFQKISNTTAKSITELEEEEDAVNIEEEIEPHSDSDSLSWHQDSEEYIAPQSPKKQFEFSESGSDSEPTITSSHSTGKSTPAASPKSSPTAIIPSNPTPLSPTTTTTTTTTTTPTIAAKHSRSKKRAVSPSILNLQKECGFFKRPPPSLSGVDHQTQIEPQTPTEFVHVPISTPNRSRPRGPPRRPPTPTRR